MHSLIEDINKYGQKLDPDFWNELKNLGLSSIHIKNNFENSVCFDIGDLDSFIEIKWEKELVRFPFNNCFFKIEKSTGKGKGVLRLGIHYHVFEDKYGMGLLFVRGERNLPWVPRALWLDDTNLNPKAWFSPSSGISADAHIAFVNVMRSVVFSFVSAINCVNIKMIEKKPDRKLQIARKKKGKAPLFSYWVLNLKIPKTKTVGDDLGGTHASPRVHLRRGHPRQYEPGKWCWVQPHIVGDKSKGLVMKDYKARWRADA